jgi:hypothetical protein
MREVTGNKPTGEMYPVRDLSSSREQGIDTRDSVVLSGSRQSSADPSKGLLEQIREQNRLSYIDTGYSYEAREKKLDNFEEGYTKPHMDRVNDYCSSFADALKNTDFKLSAEDEKALKTATSVYDVGKLAISNKLWNKKGKPDEEEWKQMQRHVNVSTTGSIESGKERDMEVERQFDGFIDRESRTNDVDKAISIIMNVGMGMDIRMDSRKIRFPYLLKLSE